MAFNAPEILLILFILPKVDFCGISGAHSNSCYVTPFDIFKTIFIKFIFIFTIALLILIRTPGNWHKAYQNIRFFFNYWIKTVEEAVDLFFNYLFSLFSDICSNWPYLPIIIITIKQDNASPTVHHRAYFSLYSYSLFIDFMAILNYSYREFSD
jgi:hypothetical protein